MTSPSLLSISRLQFESLAAGYGDEQTMTLLVDGQLSRRKLLLRTLAQELAEGPADAGARRRFEESCALLTELEQTSPEVVTGQDGVLRHPYVGVWAMYCLRELVLARQDPAAHSLLADRLSYFSALVAVAATRAGRELELETVVPAEGLMFPMVGLMSGPVGPATIVVQAGDLTVRGADGAIARCTPTRVLTTRRARPGPIRLEDQDPFRNAFGHVVTGRLGVDEVTRWSDRLTAAWLLIREHHRGYLPGLTAGLCSVTPLAAQPSGNDASSASRHAFGAISSVLPPTATRLALLLVHEFQHVKLGGVLDLVQLVDESDTGLYHAPWRPDPRPLPALLQGTYAHLAVTDFWRRQRHVPGTAAEATTADAQFRHWREQTAQVIAVMLGTSSLTAEGRRFITVMGETIGAWQDDDLPVGSGSHRRPEPA